MRAGVLCGQCRNESAGYSALLNDCVSCNDASGLLILALSKLYAVSSIYVHNILM